MFCRNTFTLITVMSYCHFFILEKTVMERLIFIFRYIYITCCYPFKVPTLIKYSHCMLTFKP